MLPWKARDGREVVSPVTVSPPIISCWLLVISSSSRRASSALASTLARSSGQVKKLASGGQGNGLSGFSSKRFQRRSEAEAACSGSSTTITGFSVSENNECDRGRTRGTVNSQPGEGSPNSSKSSRDLGYSASGSSVVSAIFITERWVCT